MALDLASRQQAAQSPGMHTALHGLSMLCVRDDLLRLQQLLFDVQLQRRFLDSTTAAKGSATPAVVVIYICYFICLEVILRDDRSLISGMSVAAGLTAEFAAVFCPLECQAQNLA